MKSHHIKLALVATIRTRPNLNIPADEISSVFIPLSNELFEMIHKVLTANRENSALSKSLDSK